MTGSNLAVSGKPAWSGTSTAGTSTSLWATADGTYHSAKEVLLSVNSSRTEHPWLACRGLSRPVLRRLVVVPWVEVGRQWARYRDRRAGEGDQLPAAGCLTDTPGC
jgi:hypothetical protein